MEPIITPRGQLRRRVVLASWLSLAATACSSRLVDCKVMRPTIGVPYRVLSSYRHSLFRDECRISTAREVMIEQTDYSVWAEFVADEEPKVLLGIVSPDQGRFSIDGDAISALFPAEIKGHAAFVTRRSSLSTGAIDFRVNDLRTSKSLAYHIPFDLVDCTCRRFDGP